MKRLLKKKISKFSSKIIYSKYTSFRDASIKDDKAPIESNDFDEAQRAWTEKQASNFMRRNKRDS
jgi:Ser-tRNA(Ala) deacylase AlaX